MPFFSYQTIKIFKLCRGRDEIRILLHCWGTFLGSGAAGCSRRLNVLLFDPVIPFVGYRTGDDILNIRNSLWRYLLGGSFRFWIFQVTQMCNPRKMVNWILIHHRMKYFATIIGKLLVFKHDWKMPITMLIDKKRQNCVCVEKICIGKKTGSKYSKMPSVVLLEWWTHGEWNLFLSLFSRFSIMNIN